MLPFSKRTLVWFGATGLLTVVALLPALAEPAPQGKPTAQTVRLRIDYGTSYVQTVTFDAKGPVAQAILAYGQSTNPASPHANDQMREFSAKRWHTLPFHRDDAVKARVGEPLRLVRP